MLEVIGLIQIENDKILLVKKRDVWIFPGGKRNLGETDTQCLERELMEELNVRVSIGNFYRTFRAIAPYGEGEIEIRNYFGYILGTPRLTPGDSVIDFLSTSNPERYNLSEAMQKSIKSLKEDHYLR